MSPRGFRVSYDEFVRIAQEVLESLPSAILDRLTNVAIDVEDEPDDETLERFRREEGRMRRRDLLGLFVGVPFDEQPFGIPLPCRIRLYKRNIEAIAYTRQDLIDQIRQTLIHEIGHHVGYSDEELEAFESRGPDDAQERD